MKSLEYFYPKASIDNIVVMLISPASEWKDNAEERKCLEIMELKISEVSLESLKRQYKKLAKKYHPDTNQGDKDAEEKFKQLTNAYSLLLAKHS